MYEALFSILLVTHDRSLFVGRIVNQHLHSFTAKSRGLEVHELKFARAVRSRFLESSLLLVAERTSQRLTLRTKGHI